MHRVSNNPSNNPMAKVIRTVETIGRAGTDTLHKVGSSGAAKGVETIGRAGTDALRKVGCGAAKGGGEEMRKLQMRKLRIAFSSF